MKRVAIIGVILLLLIPCACSRKSEPAETFSLSPQFDIESPTEPTEAPEEVTEEIGQSVDEATTERSNAEEDALSTKQVDVSDGKFNFTINEFYDALHDNVFSVRMYRNSGLMTISYAENNSELGIVLYGNNFSSFGAIQFDDNDIIISDKDVVGFSRVTALIDDTDTSTLTTVLMSIIVTFDPQIKTEEDCGLLIAEIAAAEDDTGLPSVARNGIVYELYNTSDTWFFIITPDENNDTLEATEQSDVTDDGHIAGGGTITTYPFEADGTATKSSGNDAVTAGERNALSMAREYLAGIPLSYSGLVEQLEYEGFSHDEAVYGADNCGADWNEQAANMAAFYLDTMAFSRSGLIEQLEYEGFSHEQAIYGAKQNGY